MGRPARVATRGRRRTTPASRSPSPATAKPDSIAYECEQSLKRLRVDVIDLYQIHWPDLTTPIEESIAAMEKLRKAGKIRAIGVSNYNAKQLAAADTWLKANGSVLASLQPPYSVINRGIEKEVLPYCRQHEHRRGRLLADGARAARPGSTARTTSSRAGDHRGELQGVQARGARRRCRRRWRR